MKSLKKLIPLMVVAAFLLAPAGLTAAKKNTKKKGWEKIKFPPLNEIKKVTVLKDQTANGIKLRLMKNDKLPLVDFIVLLKGGDHFDPKGRTGLGTITAQLMRIGGTASMSPAEVEKRLDSKGISINISSNDSFYLARVGCLKENFGEAVQLLADMMMNPAFDKEKVEEYKGKLMSSISRRNDTPRPISSREFDKMIYGKSSPFARILEYEDLDNIERKDLVQNHQRFFAPGNMLAGITGPIDMAEYKKILETHFGPWKQSAKVPDYPKAAETDPGFDIGLIHKSNLNQSTIRIGHMGTLYDPALNAKTRLFNSIFSQGIASRLFNRVRTEMGLTYGIGGGIFPGNFFKGTVVFSTTTKCESTIDAIEAIEEEIRKIREEPVTEKELEEARESFLNSYVFEFSTPDRVLQSQLVREYFGIPQDISEKMLGEVRKISVGDIKETAQTFLHPERMKITIVTNKDKLSGDLSKLGKVKELDISIPPPAVKIPEPTPETLEKGGKVINALFTSGKYSAYKKLKSLISDGNMSMTINNMALDMGMKVTTLYPGKVHVSVSVMGRSMTTIINGKKGVNMAGPQSRPMDEKQIEAQKFGDLYDLAHAKGKYKFQYLWEKKTDGKTYDVVYIFDASKNWTKLFINKATGLIEIEEKISRLPGQSGVARDIKSDFRTIDGLTIAFKSESFVKDKKVASLTLKEVKVNTKVDPSLFKIEEKK